MLTPPKPLLRRSALVLAALALFVSGCTIHQRESTRIRSFAPFENHYVQLTHVRTYLSSRTALLLNGDDLRFENRGNGTLRGSSSNGSAGCAAAIDRRGYFLTAAHCVDDTPVYLLLVEPGKPARVLRARVVWRANLQNGEPDLALLHIPEVLGNVFSWAESPSEGDPVMAVGISKTKKKIKGPQCIGGKILADGKRKTDGDGSSARVLHDIPLQPGDSGGPLVTSAARLIGINIEGALPFVRFLPGFRYPESVAERPDPEWLANLVEKDAATPRVEEPQEVFILRAPQPPQPPQTGPE